MHTKGQRLSQLTESQTAQHNSIADYRSDCTHLHQLSTMTRHIGR